MQKTIEQTIFDMITENTGTHMLDSGGVAGRNWQRNKDKTLDDFKNEPEATLSFYGIERDNNGVITSAIPEVSVSIFHKLTSGILELDDLCHKFNAMPCNNWDGDYYGVSQDQFNWLGKQGFLPKGVSHNQLALWTIGKYDLDIGWNTYNWDNQFSQVLHGTDLELNGGAMCIDGGNYVLLNIHGGADVRGGYTDAKLFRLDDHCEFYSVVTDDCSFGLENPAIESDTPDIFTGEKRNNIVGLDWRGEWSNYDGYMADDNDFLLMAQISNGDPIDGYQNNDF